MQPSVCMAIYIVKEGRPQLCVRPYQSVGRHFVNIYVESRHRTHAQMWVWQSDIIRYFLHFYFYNSFKMSGIDKKPNMMTILQASKL